MTILPTHTCFDDAMEFLDLLAKESLVTGDASRLHRATLVHAVCLNPVTDEPFAHAWVEIDGDAWDAGVVAGERVYLCFHTAAMFRSNLRVQSFTEYTGRQACEENVRTGTLGPWREEFKQLCGRNELLG